MASTQSTQTAIVVRTVRELRARVAAWRADSQQVALVPTMGALHDGHVSLIQKAGREADRVIVSIFVNPRQFAPGEDFDSYPRNEIADVEKISEAGGHLCFAPVPSEIYGDDFATTVSVAGLTEIMCGASRPGHFDGVATVVTKLLLQALPDAAVFGEKDFQQLMVIRRLVADLDMPVRIISGETVREEDGLAMSSRNRYLTAKDRARAASLPRILGEMAARARNGEDLRALESAGRDSLLSSGFEQVDYLEFRQEDDLRLASNIDAPLRVFAAARIAGTRLIDNHKV